MKSKGKIIGFLVLVVVICAIIFLASKISTHNETIGDTGWTIDQFIEWAYDVEPVVAHRRWKLWKEGFETTLVPDPVEGPKIRKVWKDMRKELMDSNEPFQIGIINDANDIPWQEPLYKYEWDFKLPSPYEKLPEPVRKVIDSVNQESVGNNIGEILPYAARPVAICALKEGKPVSSEALEARLLNLSDDKLKFTIETEPFILSDNPDFTGKIGNKMLLYVPTGTKVNICKPEKQKKGVNHEK